MISVILTDIDNTLLKTDKTFSPKTREALLKAEEQGIRICIASGRSVDSVRDIAKELGLKNPILSGFNGNLIVDGDTVYRDVHLTPKAFDTTIKTIHGEADVIHSFSQHAFIFQGSDEIWKIWQKFFNNTGFHLELKTYEETKKLLGGELYNIFFWQNDDEKKLQQMAALEEVLQGEADIIPSGDKNYEVFPKGTDKGITIDILMEAMGKDRSEFMAFGDWDNDYGMIRRAGIGVVMENGSPMTKSVADFITKDCDSDGIPYALEHFGVLHQDK